MNIVIVGYGKMGHAIERIALERGHHIAARIDVACEPQWESPEVRGADAAIEFSTPATAEANVRRALAAELPVVCGSTGWTDALPAVRAEVERMGGSMIWSSNYSVGVNLFDAVNAYMARLMEHFGQYTVNIHEVHHIHKLDHPSGTARTLAETIIGANGRIDAWAEEVRDTDVPHTVAVSHERRGEVPGIHTVTWDSPVDSITLSHSAKSRDGFALGAVIAAEWLAANPGWHTFAEVLDIKA